LTDLFSPLPTERFTFFLVVIHNHPRFLEDREDFVFLAVFADCLNCLAVGAPFDPGFRMVSPEPCLIRFLFAWMLAYNPLLAIKSFPLLLVSVLLIPTVFLCLKHQLQFFFVIDGIFHFPYRHTLG